MRGEGGGGCGVSANENSCAHGVQINFGDLTPYLTYGICPLNWSVRTTHLYVMADKMKRVDVHATPTPTWADFTLMMESTSGSGHCHPVYSVAVYTVKKTGKFQIWNKSGATKVPPI
jgi:hypothetical protein